MKRTKCFFLTLGICSVILCVIVIYGNLNDKNITFNKIAASSLLIETQNYELVESISVSEPTNGKRIILSDVDVPKDFNKKKTGVYDETNITQSVYINAEKNRSVCLQSTSNGDDIAKQKQLCSSMKKSKIEGVDLYLCQYYDADRKGNIHTSCFELNNIYYILETKNCAEDEHINILKGLFL